jgi:predicted transcriptional regulator
MNAMAPEVIPPGSARTSSSTVWNIAFFLTPKSEVVWVSASGCIEQALERMKPNGFSAVPILDDEGCYVGTLSTSDLIWYLFESGSSWQERARATPLLNVPRRLHDSPVHIDADMTTLMSRAENQSFVSVVDDRGVFIGIVRRRPIIELCARLAGLGRVERFARAGSRQSVEPAR